MTRLRRLPWSLLSEVEGLDKRIVVDRAELRFNKGFLTL